MSEGENPMDEKTREYMREIGRRGGAAHTKKQIEAGRRNVKKALVKILERCAEDTKYASSLVFNPFENYCLDILFLWSKSPQGHRFWKHVSRDIELAKFPN